MQRYFSNLPFPKGLCYDRAHRLKELSNGVKVVTEDWNSPVQCVGLMIDAGSRMDFQMPGVAYLTSKLLERNLKKKLGFVDFSFKKDYTWVAVKGPDGLEELTKCLVDFRVEEGFTEVKDQVLSELDEYQLLDHVHKAAFKGHALGNFTKGEKSSIKSTKKEDVYKFLRTHYTGNRVTVSAAGGIEASQVLKKSKTLEELPKGKPLLLKSPNYTSSNFVKSSSSEYTHLGIAFPAPACTQSEYVSFRILENLMNNPFYIPYVNHSEQFNTLHALFTQTGGLVQHGCEYISYKEAGLLFHHLVTEPLASVFLASSVLKAMLSTTSAVLTEELYRAKNQVFTQLAAPESSPEIAFENANQIRKFGDKVSRSTFASNIYLEDPEVLASDYDKWISNALPVIGVYGKVVAENLPELIYKQASLT